MKILSFDAEANGLHGEAFAVGAVLVVEGAVVEEFFARCPIDGPVDPWVTEHVIPALCGSDVTHASAREMREAFWTWLMSHKQDATIVCDCGWPVEAGLLSACVADDPSRAFEGPYPLHEVATLLLSAGMDPKGDYGAEMMSAEELAAHRPHHPVDDARLSALCALHALRASAAARPFCGARRRGSMAMPDDAVGRLREASRNEEIAVRRDDLAAVLDAIYATRLSGRVLPDADRRAMLAEVKAHPEALGERDSGWHMAYQCLLAMEDMARACWPRGGVPSSTVDAETAMDRLRALCGQGAETVAVSCADLAAAVAEARENAEQRFDAWCQIGPASMVARMRLVEANRLRAELAAARSGREA